MTIKERVCSIVMALLIFYAMATNAKDLQLGDTITYTTKLGTRTYQVATVETIGNDDWSYLQATMDNRLTITTCLADHPENRVCVQAVEVLG